MNAKRVAWGLVVVMAVGLGLGCHKSDDGGSGGRSGGAKASGVEKEAADAAMAEVMKHWTKNADGWVTAKDSGSSFAPFRYLREFRELTVEGVESFELSDADRLNGFEWAGQVSLKKAPCREAGEPGILLDGMAQGGVMRRRGAWSQWVDFTPEALRVQKVKGRWQVQPDNMMLTGKAPGPEDYANAGVR